MLCFVWGAGEGIGVYASTLRNAGRMYALDMQSAAAGHSSSAPLLVAPFQLPPSVSLSHGSC